VRTKCERNQRAICKIPFYGFRSRLAQAFGLLNYRIGEVASGSLHALLENHAKMESSYKARKSLTAFALRTSDKVSNAITLIHAREFAEALALSVNARCSLLLFY